MLGSNEKTIGNLDYEPIVIEKRPIEEVDKQALMANYRQLLSLNPEQQLNNEATRRLADLQLDEQESRLLEQAEATELKADDLSSIPLYESLLARNGDFANRDQVIYQLSRAYELAGEMSRMMQMLDRLVAEHPQSPHWLEAQFRRGERLFVLQDYAAAESAYASLVQRKRYNPFYDRALFKQGWSHFKQQRIEAGLDSFTKLLDLKLNHLPEMDAGQLSPSDQDLLKETLRVISLTFSELGGAQRITRYFKEHGSRAYEFMVYRSLGAFYEKQQRIKDAADTYMAFVNIDPSHKQSPRLAVEVIGLYERHNFPKLALESKKQFTDHYRMRGLHWQQLAADDQAWLKNKLRTYLLELTEYHHALLQQYDRGVKKSVAERNRLGEQAVQWYHQYLETFPAEHASGNMSFLLGDLLIDLERYPEAVVAYERSAYLYPPHKNSAEAGYAALLAYATQAERLQEGQQKTWQEDSVTSALRFAAAFPSDTRVPDVLTQTAELLFELKDLSQARQVALRVPKLQPPPKPQLQRTAWTVAAHAAFDMEDYAAAEAAYQEVLALTPKQDKSREKLQERLAASIYQQGMAQRNLGDHQSAARQFMRVGQLVPNAAIRATADFDAAASLIALEQWSTAIGLLEAFRQRYPNHPSHAEVNTKLAVAYLKTDQPLKAAAEFSTLANQGGSAELQREAAWQAAELYTSGGSQAHAIEAYETYVERFPAPLEQAIEARQRLADMHGKAGASSAEKHWLDELIKADANGGSGRSDRTRFLAAHASLRLAKPTHELFNQVRLKAPLKENLQRKKQRMQGAIDRYEQAAAYGILDVTTAATFHIGEIYQQFGIALMESERPQGLNAEELEQYEILLEEQALPFEDKSISLHEANVQRAAEGVYDEWVKKSFAALAKLLPARYAKQELAEEAVDAIN
jgi:tetratricopeptide (TPR) repeat protein